MFELPNDEASLIPVASCLVVKASDPEALVDAKGKPIIRPYTPVSPPDAPGELTLLVKRYENGNMSKYMFSLKVRLHLSLLRIPLDSLCRKEILLLSKDLSQSSLTKVYSTKSDQVKILTSFLANEFDEVALIGGGSGMWVSLFSLVHESYSNPS